MAKQIDHQKWMAFFNETLQELKKGLDQADKKLCKGKDKQTIAMLHTIYDEINRLTIKYEHSHTLNDLNALCYKLTELKPSFILNYQSIIDD